MTFQRVFAALMFAAILAFALSGEKGTAGTNNENPSEGTTAQVRKGARPFSIEVVGAAKRVPAYGDNVVLTMKITCTSQVEFKEFALVPLGDLRALYAPEVGQPDGSAKGPQRESAKDPQDEDMQSQLGEGDLGGSDLAADAEVDVSETEPGHAIACEHEDDVFGEAGTTLVVTCPLGAGARSLWRPNTWLLAPGQQQVLFRITTTDDSESPSAANNTDTESADSENVYYEEVPITFRAPLGAIFLGGLTGALLLALFTAVRMGLGMPAVRLEVGGWDSLKGVAQRFEVWVLNLFPQAWKMLLETVLGGICAIILILLAQSTEGLNPPISIKIQDFWGGVVTGLFSIPLSRWIWAQVHPEPVVPPQSAFPLEPTALASVPPSTPDAVPPSTPDASPPEATEEKAPA